MAVSADDILCLLAELEQGDPLEFGETPVDEADARRLVALSMAKFSDDLAAQGIGAESREALALATAARVLLDNMRLHYQLLVKQGEPTPDANALLRAIAAGPMKR